MKIKTIQTDQRGIGHLLVVGIIAFILILGSGIAFIRYSQKNKVAQKQQAQLQAQQDKQKAEQELLKAQEQKSLTAKAAETVTPAPQTAPTECSRTETLYVTAKDSLSVRTEKSSGSKALIFAPYGATMKVGCLDGDWYASEYKGHVGYSLKSYLSPTKPAAMTTPPSQSTTVAPAHPTSCAPNNADFTVYASVPGGTPTYWRDNRGARSPLALIPYGQAMVLHCYPDDNIQNIVYEDFWVNPNDVTTTKP